MAMSTRDEMEETVMRVVFPMTTLIWLLGTLAPMARAGPGPDRPFPLFEYLTSQPSPSLVVYTPSELDPRDEGDQRRLLTSSIRADLNALRPAFDGLVLYGYNESCTPRIVALARELKYRGIVLAVWDPKSSAELDGVAELARLHEKELALAVLVGNEGITLSRYEAEDLGIAADRLRRKIPASVPLSTSEPLRAYTRAPVREFGDFLAPNISPVFDRPDLGPREAAQWVREEAARLAAQTGRPVLVKQTGFPHAGKHIYTRETQAAFWSAYLEPRRLAGSTQGSSGPWVFHGVGFEAFDLPWKSLESGLIMEKSWGLMSVSRQPYASYRVWQRAAR
jgi:exo-beta-1,3-glucanase (GH17 family)